MAVCTVMLRLCLDPGILVSSLMSNSPAIWWWQTEVFKL